MIEFVSINEENFKDVIDLEVAEGQKNFVAPNVRSLAECYLYRNNNDVFPYAIQYVKGNEVMGRLLRFEGFKDYSFNKKDNEYVLHYELKDSIDRPQVHEN